MVGTRDSALIKSEIIRYLNSLGLVVNTVTKARGNRGFFKDGRIDISKSLDVDTALRVLVHEFAHYSHFILDKNLNDLTLLFQDNSQFLINELLAVTKFVDENAKCKLLSSERDKLIDKTKELTAIIKNKYPDFSLTGDFKPFKKYAKWSDVRYLEKYDRVKINSVTSSKVYSISNIKNDFPDISEEFVAYLTLRSQQRKRAKLSRRITKLNKYYSEPCELFARFVEGLYLDNEKVKTLAPSVYEKFVSLYNKNHYPHLRELFSILRILIY